MRAAVAEMQRRHHRAQRRLDRALRIGQEIGDAGERLVRFGIEDVQDGADQQRVAGLLPMIAPLQRAFGIDQDVGDVLDVAHLRRRRAGLRAADCRRTDAALVGSNSSTRPKRARQPAVRAQFSPLISWTMRGAGPGEQRRDDEADALAGPGRREAQDMLGAIMAQIVVARIGRARRHRARAARPLRTSSAVAQRADP